MVMVGSRVNRIIWLTIYLHSPDVYLFGHPTYCRLPAFLQSTMPVPHVISHAPDRRATTNDPNGSQ